MLKKRNGRKLEENMNISDEELKQRLHRIWTEETWMDVARGARDLLEKPLLEEIAQLREKLAAPTEPRSVDASDVRRAVELRSLHADITRTAAVVRTLLDTVTWLQLAGATGKEETDELWSQIHDLTALLARDRELMKPTEKPDEPMVEKRIADAVAAERARIVEWLRESNNKPEEARRIFIREQLASAIKRCEHTA